MIARAVLFLAAAALMPAVAYEVVGTVTDEIGAVIPEAGVWLSQDRYVQSTTTDGRGRFSFHDVKAGHVELVAYRERWSIGGAEGDIIDDTQTTIVLGVPDAISIRAIDPAGGPIEGARLKTMFVGSLYHVPVADLVDHGFPSIRSDSDGVLAIPFLPKGSHAGLSIAHRSYAESEIPTLPVGTELDVRFERGQRLRGRVVNDAQQPVVRARVSVFRGEKEFTEVLSDAEGFYSALVPRGEYYVAARHPEYAMPDPVSAVSDGDGAIANLTMPPPHIIRGSVIGPKGEAVGGAQIGYIARNILFQEAISDIEGTFQVTVSAGEGILRVYPPPRMYTVKSPDIPFTLTETRLIDLEPIELARLPEMEGRVEYADGKPAANALVTTLELAHPKRAVTDEDGRFALQLDAMPSSESVTLRAEDAARFLRRDEVVNLRRLKPQTLRLRNFEPDLSPAPPKPPNRLHHMVGDAAPEIVCEAWFNLPEGQESLSLTDLRGKIVVLTMWGGWDFLGVGPDRTDELNRLYAMLKDAGDVAFVSVHDGSSSVDEVRRYVAQYGIPFPVGRDADPSLTFDAYNVNTIPQTVLIDKQGIFRYFHVDGRLLELIKDLRRR